MAIDFANNAPKSGSIFSKDSNNRADQPKAQVWINIGYTMSLKVTDEAGKVTDEDRFISIPVGIPLDTMEPKALQGRSEEYRQLVAAQNNLLEMLQDAAKQLEPGQEELVNLQIQMRRVQDAPSAPSAEENVFIPKSMELFAPKA